jgi:hypothetical protein
MHAKNIKNKEIMNLEFEEFMVYLELISLIFL